MKKEAKLKSTTKVQCAGRTLYAVCSSYEPERIATYVPAGKKTEVPMIFAREDLARAAIEVKAMRTYNDVIDYGDDENYAEQEADYTRQNYVVVKHEIFKEASSITVPKKKKQKKAARPARPAVGIF